MLTIKILGHGCQNCQKLEKVTRQAVTDLHIEANVVKVSEDADIFAYPILSTPGLVINEKLVCAGRIPNAGEVARWVKESLAVN